MHIKFVEIQNFRKLKSIRIEFTNKTTLFVGANNSGKTSAMDALGHFLVDKKSFSTNDFTLTNWKKINKIGTNWEEQSAEDNVESPILDDWEDVLPTMDVWLHVEENEIHHVSHLIPTLDWDGGSLGVRLRFEPKDIDYLYKDYLLARKSAKETTELAKQKSDKITIELWPSTMREFLDRKLSNFIVRSYILDPSKCTKPKNGIAIPQPLPLNSGFLDRDPFQDLMRIDDINAQRGLSDVGKKGYSDGEVQQQNEKRKLSTQLRDYYAKHLDPSEFQEPSDLDALQAIDSAQVLFNEKLRDSFSNALSELEELGYPGFADPRLTISTKIEPIDGLNHETAVQFEITDQGGITHKKPLRLPEQYNGLGYQNLISMVFKLMSFRDAWMQVGKAAKKALPKTTDTLPPLHLVLVEEPEAHLHAQVQQVFIRKAHSILCNHDDLSDKPNLTTQLVISTHSSHIAHEMKFSCLRYFRRVPAYKGGIDIPTSSVVNLSEVFDEKDNTQQFVTRYLKTTHCDLFFADAAILVEGPAERMLVPHFIQQNFKKLNQSYLTILEIGGSHAHRLQPLIEHLGLITLVITDLDSSDPAGTHPPRQPIRGAGLITRNSTLKTWVPEIEEVEKLLDLPESKKIKKYNDLFSIYAAYQCPVNVTLSKERDEEALAYTFEDALVFENIDVFRRFSGFGLGKKFKTAIEKNDSSFKLGEAMFEALKNGNKAEFALDILNLENLERLQTPKYISDGLKWLQKQIQRKQEEILVLSKEPNKKD